ncbi:energy-coupling factor ABC transporter permease [Actinokineospora auranticolor]|uniref:Cobalt/nickel transport system permease protein n=1 Tax=Actinokineospora auranticolor TaxID=155976 RepID=A0A2S6GBT0_9PSEU|nr:energy-coupling factor ABC transporter permease [Actinokineospora auranticolor]PPK61579.1 cobalt/nickel transport system permease protein [Actinokineospora auranticolor]
MTADVAMHMSDGLLNTTTSLLFAAVAVIGIAVAAARARDDLDDRTAPMAGLVAAFVFATQMLNFPVLPGVSGHLLGGALAAILVGPWVGALCVSIVLVVQALVFADGGVTALGANVTNMAIIGTAVGFAVATVLKRFTRTKPGLAAVAFTAAFVNTVVASLGFVLEFALGGDPAFGLGGVTATIVGVHCLIGIGEGVITALTVVAIAAVRPDLVHLLRGARRPLDVREESPA